MSKPTAVAALVLALLVSLVLTPPAQAQDVWSLLRSTDGVAIVYRHALAPGGGDPANFRLADCSTQRNLSRDGRLQARHMGRQLRTARVPVSRVLASPWCRSRETAELMDLGPVSTRKRLGSVFQSNAATAAKRERATRKLIEKFAANEGVLIIVGHQANIIDLTGIAPTSGEGVVVGVDPATNDLEILGRVPAPPIT